MTVLRSQPLQQRIEDEVQGLPVFVLFTVREFKGMNSGIATLPRYSPTALIQRTYFLVGTTKATDE
jgi:hypothetical protein